MTKQEAINFFGSTQAVSHALGCAQSSVSEWLTIPLGRQYQIELATKGKLKADKPALRSKPKLVWTARV